MNSTKKKTNLKQLNISLIIFLIFFQNLPVISEKYYDYIRVIIYLAFLATIIIIILENKIKIKTIHMLFMIAILFGIVIDLISYINYSKNLVTLEFAIPLGVMILGSSSRDKFNHKVINYYVLMSIIVGVSNILYYNKGFSISNIYTVPNKNQIGVILGTSAIISLYNFFYKEKKFYSFISLIILIITILANRNRTVLLGIIILIIMMFIINMKKIITNQKNIKIMLFLIVIIVTLSLFGMFNNLYSYTFKSIFLNYDVTDIDSISAGRWNVYIKSLLYVKDNFLFGKLFNDVQYIGIPHNYAINKLYTFGVIGSLPFMVVYFFITIEVMFKILNKKLYLTDYIMIFMLVVSLLEYTYPFGPGTSQFLLWFLYGYSITNNKKEVVCIG